PQLLKIRQVPFLNAARLVGLFRRPVRASVEKSNHVSGHFVPGLCFSGAEHDCKRGEHERLDHAGTISSRRPRTSAVHDILSHYETYVGTPRVRKGPPRDGARRHICASATETACCPPVAAGN